MKQLYTFIIITLCCMAANPCLQAQGHRHLNKEQAELLFNAKMKMMQEKLSLTDSQTEQLIPLYQSYTKELNDIFKSRKYHRGYKPASADDACNIITERLDINERVIKLQKKYIRKYAEFLNADQVMNIYRVEGQIQREIRKEKRRRAGK